MGCGLGGGEVHSTNDDVTAGTPPKSSNVLHASTPLMGGCGSDAG